MTSGNAARGSMDVERWRSETPNRKMVEIMVDITWHNELVFMGVISWFINRLYYCWGGSPQMPTKCLGRASWVNKPMAKSPGTWLFQLNLQGPSLQLDHLSLEPRAADPPLLTHYCSLGSIILQHMNTIWLAVFRVIIGADLLGKTNQARNLAMLRILAETGAERSAALTPAGGQRYCQQSYPATMSQRSCLSAMMCRARPR